MAKKLPDYAKKVGKSKKLPDYARRVGPYATHTEPEPGIGQKISETVGDAALAGFQSATLDTADDIVEMASPSLADKYRQQLAKGRERSPYASGTADLLAPNPMAKAKILGKGAGMLRKGVQELAPEVGTSVVHQMGSEGEVGLGQTAFEVAGGKALEKGVGKVLVGDRLKRRAGTMGQDHPSYLKKQERARGKGQDVDEFIAGQASELEDMDLFKAGPVEFDAKKGKFVSADKSMVDRAKSLPARTAGAVIPPSDKEILKRLRKAKENTGKRLEAILETEAADQALYKEFLESDAKVFDDMYRTVMDGDYEVPATAEQAWFDSLQRIFNNERGAADVSDILREKRRLDKIINKSKGFDKTLDLSGDKIEAYDTIRQELNNVLDQTITDPDFRRLNQQYGKLSKAQEALDSKMVRRYGQKADEGVDPMYAAPVSPAYKFSRFLSDQKENLMERPGAQMGQTLERSPQIQDYLRGVGAGAVPRLMDQGNQGRSPDALSQRNLPAAIANAKLPRNVEGLMQNKEVLLAKVAQQAPQLFNHVKFIVEQRPEELETLLPMAIKMMPQAFEYDKYGRINGKILDPIMQEKARKDLMQDQHLSNTERINKIDMLNRTNRLEDYR